MPTDEMVEKVARAMEEAEFGYSLRFVSLIKSKETWALRYSDGETLEFDSSASAYEHIAAKKRRTQARAALAAAEAGEQPVGYAVWYFDNKKPDLQHNEPKPSPVITRVAPLFASPPSEASRDERAAIRKEAFEEAARALEAMASENDGPTRQGEATTVGAMRRVRADWQREDATAIRARGET